MNILIYTNKVKNSYLNNLNKEYLDRINKFCNINIQNNLQNKSNRIYCINISNDTNTISSLDFAKKLNDITVKGYSNIIFYIGDNQIKSPDFEISITNMNVSDEMKITMLIEQIYRAFKINNNEVYHK